LTYYYNDGEKLIYGSEIKAILNSGLIEPTFNEDAIELYLGYRYVLEPYTFFNEIKQFKSSCYYIFKKDENGSKGYM
jgi:asparagine synthase (glutamine-hydrolysing)